MKRGRTPCSFPPSDGSSPPTSTRLSARRSKRKSIGSSARTASRRWSRTSPGSRSASGSTTWQNSRRRCEFASKDRLVTPLLRETTPLLRETRLRENVWVWTLGGDRIETSYGANCTAVVGRDSVLVVDALIAPSFARLVESALFEKTSLPVKHVVVTHHHTDHALGGSWFAGRGATVTVHPACRDAMAAEHPGLVAARRQVPELAMLFRDAEPYRPDEVVEDSVTFDLGGSAARVFHPGHEHTAGDLVVELKA